MMFDDQFSSSLFVVDFSLAEDTAIRDAIPNSAEVVVLRQWQDPLQTILDKLTVSPGITTLHILAHGSLATMQLAGQDISVLMCSGHEQRCWRNVGVALGAKAEIFVYACNFAAGPQGDEVLARFAEVTGASVAAGSHRIGASEFGGSWYLDKQLGEIASPQFVAFNYTGVLASFAFAALKSDGSVVTWGGRIGGGDSSSVSAELSSGVENIFSTRLAFAALKSDGSVVTWGDAATGGDSSSVSAELTSGVETIYSNGSAFAALKGDGSVVTWGAAGGDSSSVSAELSSGVETIYSNGSAFAALKSDGSVVTWGNGPFGGDSGSVSAELSSGVVSVFPANRAFAALKTDGSVVTWGLDDVGGDSSSVSAELSANVDYIFSNSVAFAALKSDGSVVTWGFSTNGGDSNSVSAELTSDVETIVSTRSAFAALKNDGSVVTWGFGDSGGDSSSVSAELSSGVETIYSNGSAFAALKNDGSVVTWGDRDDGGDSSSVSAELSSGVETIYSAGSAFAALKSDGSVVTWGNGPFGGDSGSVSAELSSGVETIYSNGSAFAALKSDGSVITWGAAGGDSSSVAMELSSGVIGLASPFGSPAETGLALPTKNEPPIAFDDVASFPIGANDFEISVLANDTDADGDPLTVISALATNGSVEITADNTLLYTPNDPASAADTITYEISDGNGGTDSAVVTVTDAGDTTPPALLSDGLSLEAGLLILTADQAWEQQNGVFSVSNADVVIGYAGGDLEQIRIANATVSVNATTVTASGVFSALSGSDTRTLFEGTIDLNSITGRGTISSTVSSGSDTLLGGLVSVLYDETFTVRPQSTLFETDLTFGPARLEPVSVVFSDSGRVFGPSEITLDPLETYAFEFLVDSYTWNPRFANLSVSYNRLEDAFYFRVSALLSSDTFLGGFLGGLGATFPTIGADFSGENFIRVREVNGALEWDVVGDVYYVSIDNPLGGPDLSIIESATFSVDTIQQELGGALELNLPFLGVEVGSSATFQYDPVRIEAAEISLGGLYVPLATTGLALTGGALGAQGLAQIFDTGGSWLDAVWSGRVDMRLATPPASAPIVTGFIDGSFGSGSVSAGVGLDITPETLLGDSVATQLAGSTFADQMENYFGISLAELANFEILSASGQVNANFEESAFSVEASVGLFSILDAEGFIGFSNPDDVFTLDAFFASEIVLPDAFIGGGTSFSANVKIKYTDNNVLSDDFAALWNTLNIPFFGEASFGFRIGFDLTFELLGTKEIELIGSWDLSPENEVVLLTAQWEQPDPNAQLVVITPSGDVITEDQFDAYDFIALADELNGPTQRSVALQSPYAGRWDIQMVQGAGALGEIVYQANELVTAPRLTSLDVSTVRQETLVDVSVSIDRVVPNMTIDLFVRNAETSERTLLQQIELGSSSQALSTTLDLSEFSPGSYTVEAETSSPNFVPSALVSDVQLELGEVPGPVPTPEPEPEPIPQPEPNPNPTSTILDGGNSNINVDGATNEFTDFGGQDTYTVLNSLSDDVTIIDNNPSVINLPEGLDISSAFFLSDGVQFTINENTVTLLGGPDGFNFRFGGTPLDLSAGSSLTYTQTASAFGTTIPLADAAPNAATQTGTVQANGTLAGTALPSGGAFFILDYEAEMLGLADRLNNIDIDGLVFSLSNGEMVSLQVPNINVAGLSHPDFVNGLQPALQALIADGTLPAGTTLSLDPSTTETTPLPDGSFSDAIPAIVLVLGDGAPVVPIGFTVDPDFSGQASVFASTSDYVPTLVSSISPMSFSSELLDQTQIQWNDKKQSEPSVDFSNSDNILLVGGVFQSEQDAFI